MVFEYKGSKILQNQDELEKFTRGFFVDVKSVLEIGFYEGGTAKWWCDHMDGGRCVSVDRTQPPMDLLADVQRMYEERGGKFVFICGDSSDPATIRKVASAAGTVDMLFIDGDHEGDMPWKDWLNYVGYVKKEGIVLFDDVNSKDVKIAYDKAREAKQEIFFKSDTPSVAGWNGLGVIIV